jgi:hypothetical protein
LLTRNSIGAFQKISSKYLHYFRGRASRSHKRRQAIREFGVPPSGGPAFLLDCRKLTTANSWLNIGTSCCALDQLEFMSGLLELGALESRVVGYAQTQESSGALLRRSHRVLQQMLLRGEIARGEVAEIVGASERTGRTVIGQLLEKGLATSPSPKGPLRLGFPSSAAAWFLPQLYPTG